MPLDVKTLVFCNFILNAFLAGLMVFYRARQKTYPGFGHWTAGWILLALGFLSMGVREHLPVLPAILATNLFFAVGSLLELDAAHRFARGRRLSLLCYSVTVPLLAVQGWFTVIHDSAAIRSAVVSSLTVSVCWLIAWAFIRDGGWGNPIHRLFAFLNILYGAASLVRVAVWSAEPAHGLFEARFFQTGFFTAILVLGTGIGLCFFLLNSQRLEQEVRAGEERFRRLVEASTMGVLFLRLEAGGRLEVTGSNRAAGAILGSGARDLSGLSLEEALPGAAGPDLAARCRATCAGGEPWHAEIEGALDGRGEVAFDVFGFQTSPGAMALLFSDVTGRKRMEAARLEMRAREQQVKLVETQSKLVQGLAHEIRNPLFAIQANVAAALKRMGEGGDPEPFVGHVSDQVRRLDTLMRDLMVLGRRPSEDKVESLDLADLVRQAAEAAEGVRPGEEGRIAVEAPLHAVAVRGDRGQLTLAFLHILENALAFAPPKSGSVWVSVGEERGRPVVRVVDRGPGILPGLLSSLFEPFVTGRTGHTGLGLTLARHYLESCGAEVRAENNDPGPGAAVIVTFPAEARG